jgi:hypothetical protein
MTARFHLPVRKRAAVERWRVCVLFLRISTFHVPADVMGLCGLNVYRLSILDADHNKEPPGSR